MDKAQTVLSNHWKQLATQNPKAWGGLLGNIFAREKLVAPDLPN